MLFSFESNETIGRNESRMATLEQGRDFCKLHIILHYISALLGNALAVLPIGKVGDDAQGRELVGLMRSAGMDTRCVAVDGRPTMNAVCFIYPDGDGGNITASNSACEAVTPAYIDSALAGIPVAREIAVAAPEVPLGARIRLLERARERGSFSVVSYTCAEAEAIKPYLALIDLLAVNLGEASRLVSGEYTSPCAVIEACFAVLRRANPDAKLIVTAGASGCYACDSDMVFLPALNVKVGSTAGAGDAMLAGTLAGLCCGLPFAPGTKPYAPISSAVELGVLTASKAVQSVDTIDFELDGPALLKTAREQALAISPEVAGLFDQ